MIFPKFCVFCGSRKGSCCSNKARATTPFGLNRCTLLCFYFFMNSLSAYVYFGWVKGLQDMLIRGGAYSWMCSSDQIAAGDDGNYLCSEQQRLIGNLITVAAVSAIVSTLVAGSMLDIAGPKITGSSGFAINLTGWTILALSSKTFEAYVAGMALIGMGCNLSCLSCLTIANLFPEKKRTIIAINATSACVSMFVFILCNAIWKNCFPHISFATIICGYIAILAFVCSPIAMLLLPWQHFCASKEERNIEEIKGVTVSLHSEDERSDVLSFESMGTISTISSAIEAQKQAIQSASDIACDAQEFHEIRVCYKTFNGKVSENKCSLPENSDSERAAEAYSKNVTDTNLLQSEDNNWKSNVEPGEDAVYFQFNSFGRASEPCLIYTVEKCGDECVRNMHNESNASEAYFKRETFSVDNLYNPMKQNFPAEKGAIMELSTGCLTRIDLPSSTEELKENCLTTRKEDSAVGDVPNVVSAREMTAFTYMQEWGTAMPKTLVTHVNTSDDSRLHRCLSSFLKRMKICCFMSIKDDIQNNPQATFIESLKNPLYWIIVFYFGMGLIRNDFLYKTAYWHFGGTVYGILGYLMPFMAVPTFTMGLLSQKFGVLFGLWANICCGCLAYVCTYFSSEWSSFVALIFFWFHMCFLQTSVIIFIFDLFPPDHCGKLLGVAFFIGGFIGLTSIPMYNAAVLREAYLIMDFIILSLCAIAAVGVGYITYMRLKRHAAVANDTISGRVSGAESI